MFLPILEYLAESFGPLRIFNYFTFRAILATLTSLVFILFFGKVFIRFVAKQKYGQVIRDDGPKSHLQKEGTPTMGGLLILFSIVLPSRSSATPILLEKKGFIIKSSPKFV